MSREKTDSIHRRFMHSERGRPAWMVTFADMMALLLTFFILMLSFSTTDAKKYKEISAAMSGAFGVSKVEDLQGLIKREGNNQNAEPSTDVAPVGETVDAQLQELLANEIKQGLVEVTQKETGVVIRFPEQAAFASASDTLSDAFFPMMRKIQKVLENSTGNIIVAGHTDDRPVYTDRFRSNWDLSAARAVSVIHALLNNSKIDSTRMVAQGYADTKPIAKNINAENRLRNRRVEITLEQPKLINSQGTVLRLNQAPQNEISTPAATQNDNVVIRTRELPQSAVN